jgi:thiol-disulfide isomerase/thioredoxin
MVRKSASSRGSKALGKSIFDVKFEVVLIIVLIIVAILLVCFINKKFNREQFYVSLIKEHMYAEGNPPIQNQSKGEQNQSPEYYEGFDLTGSNLPETLNDLTGRHVFILLGPSWCGHSKNYLRERHREFVSEFSSIKKEHLLHAIDVDIKDSSIINEIKTRSNVNALPSLFLFENGNFTKGEIDIGVAIDFVSN